MKTILVVTSLLLTIGFAQKSWAQSTTGGRSGGSTASTGTGYLTPGKRPATSNAASMTIADEGASRAYMYVPPQTRLIALPHQMGRLLHLRNKPPQKQKLIQSANRQESGIRISPRQHLFAYLIINDLCKVLMQSFRWFSRFLDK
ncbi:hypothetical protein BH09BAC4_BH09BAC4_27720 [soil metagenome]